MANIEKAINNKPVSEKTITVMGSFIMDTFAYVNRFPDDGETVLSVDSGTALGGKGVNQAVAAARQGARVRMMGALGNDEDGRCFLNLLEEERIDASCVLMHQRAATGKSMIMLDQRAENRIIVIPGANHLYEQEDLDVVAHVVRSCDLIMIQLEMRRDVNEYILRIAREVGIPVMLNPAPVGEIDRELLRSARYFTPNRAELAHYANMSVESSDDARAAINKLLCEGFNTIIATLGADGAIIGDVDGVRTVPGFYVRAVDTVGAGDAFNGALSARLIAGDNLDRAVVYANAVGAIAVTRRGAIPSIPNRDTVLEFIRNEEEKLEHA